MKEFKGDCMGVRVKERGENDSHLQVTLLVEDDENWFEKQTFDSYWIDELIEQLECAKHYLETQTPDIMSNDEQCGWKTKVTRVIKKR
jgi:hypothetical protein